MPPRLHASIVVIGDEILGGFVADTNSGWLAQRLHALGVPLDRIATVPDEIAAIDEALATELARGRPRLVLTSGGIGSTPDDVTFRACAHHLGRELVVEPEIDQRITRALAWTAQQGMAVTPDHERAMRRMAMVPAGAYLLSGARGVTPGVAVDVDGGVSSDTGASLVILPGVPGELRRIMTEGVEPELLLGRGEPHHVAEVRHPYPESTLNPVLEDIVMRFPDVHLGSYPGAECTIRLKGPEDRVTAAVAVVERYLSELAADPGAERLAAAWRVHWS